MANSTRRLVLLAAGVTTLAGGARAQAPATAEHEPPAATTAPEVEAPEADADADTPVAASSPGDSGGANGEPSAASAASAAPDSAPPAEPQQPPPAVGWGPEGVDNQTAPTAPPPAIVEPPLPPAPAPGPVDAISMFAVYYNVALPLSGTRDFVPRFSWWGFSFDFRQRLAPHVALGISFEWQGFDDKTRKTVTLGDVTVTGTQFREQTSFPLLLTGHYYLREAANSVLPFVGVGVGGYRINRALDLGPYIRFTDANWHFGVAPEIGVSFPSRTGALLLRSRLHYALKSGDAPAQLYWTLALGGAI